MRARRYDRTGMASWAPLLRAETLALLADSLPQLVWTSDAAGTVDYYNSRLTDYGRTDSADGIRWQPLVHPDDLAGTERAWAEASEAVQPYEFEHRMLMADGTYRWHLSRALPLRDEHGTVLKWFGTATDVHERRVQAERNLETSLVLQRALLPDSLPTSSGAVLAARYHPSSDAFEVGGDWYDATIVEGGLHLVIGDVAGTGPEAAAVMGAARHCIASSLRAGRSPAAALSDTSDYLHSLGHDFVTCAVVTVAADGATIEQVSAGHLPPLLVTAGTTSFAGAAIGRPLGTDDGAVYEATRRDASDIDQIVLFTDGLVERRHEPIDDSLERLRATVADISNLGAEDLCDALLERHAADAGDDVAVLVADLRE
ncbi:PP2C family protein-serine/threonine phosphatase [Dermatobacter hominis]|uniref:PP2C family protein-serine/threonine phosphatase n=1 Tax=Dermatobacter hominis TaxID=2884263 RepID=UPI001D11D166|nr:SpoIIE family protein phosphatase [Dermatobacter hominis]UDY37614.1 SpoIIE family protein phosphatase [Dermatobacter hominis]